MTSYHSNGWQPQVQHEAQHAQMASASLPAVASPVQSSVLDENQIVLDYKPPGSIPHQMNHSENRPISNKKVQWVYNPLDGSVLMDHNGDPLSVDRLLATKPLRHELSTRPGPGNKKLTYISGDDVSRTLNDVFGFDGWDLDIKDVSRVDASKDPKTGKHTIVYTARVRLTHKASGTYKEDCGAGDSTDRVYGTAIAHALKASITDAMKRAARHFGDKLGNSLYSGNFSINKAPVSLRDALDKYDIHRCNTKFGFQKQSVPKSNFVDPNSASSSANRTSMAPPTLPVESSRQQAPQMNHPPAHSTNNVFKTDTNILPRQHYNHPQQHSKDGSTNMNSHGAHQNHRYSKIAPTSNVSRSSNNYQNQNSKIVAPAPNRMMQQPQNAGTGVSASTGMSTSTITRPTSSCGRRPALGSNNPINNRQTAISSAGTGMTNTATTSVPTGNSFQPEQDNFGRRVFMEQNSNPRQTLSVNTSSTSNANPPMVTPSYNNGQNKRPPLGAIPHNGFSSESSAKRPRHHNPYNQSLTGRKSI